MVDEFAFCMLDCHPRGRGGKKLAAQDSERKWDASLGMQRSLLTYFNSALCNKTKLKTDLVRLMIPNQVTYPVIFCTYMRKTLYFNRLEKGL